MSRAGNKQRIGVLDGGDLFGEMAIIDNQPRSATARALTDLELMIISRDQLMTHIGRCDEIVSLLLRMILERYRHVLAENRRDKDGEIDQSASVAAPLLRTDGQNAMARIKLEADLRKALGRSEFRLHFQPLINLGNEQLIGFEALIRWQSAERGMVSPDKFIPLAEDTGLIVPIGRWVVAEACRAVKLFHEELAASNGTRHVCVAVNVSKLQMQSEEFFPDLVREMEANNVAPHELKIELTEGVLIDNHDFAIGWINRCKELGLRVSLDDFGTGYSSLGYLHRFPLDELKIDQSFTRTMLQQERSMEIVRAVVGLAKGLGLEIVAEGVEGKDHLHMLQRLGCEYGQGYYFDKPLPLDAALTRVRACSASVPSCA